MLWRALMSGIVSMALLVLPGVAEAHNCATKEPYCQDVKRLVQRPGRQKVISRQLGHHCYQDFERDRSRRDNRVIKSRIGVVFSEVTRDHGFLETITVYFEGSEEQALGRIDAGAKRNDFGHYDDRPRDPGTSVSLRVNQRVEMGDDGREKDFGYYTIRHLSSARVGPSPTAPAFSADCERAHHLLLRVVP